MCFNAKKYHILNISRKRQKPCLYYQLGQEALSVVDPIHRRNNIHWPPLAYEHINNISAKATRTLNFVRRNIYSCPPEAKALAYITPWSDHTSNMHLPRGTHSQPETLPILIKSNADLHASPKQLQMVPVSLTTHFWTRLATTWSTQKEYSRDSVLQKYPRCKFNSGSSSTTAHETYPTMWNPYIYPAFLSHKRL